MKLIYPACFYPCEENHGYLVTIPDLPGCICEAPTLAEAIIAGTEEACRRLLTELEAGNELPAVSNPYDLSPIEGGFTNLLVLDMDAYAQKYARSSVRKNLTIPAYMNTYIESHGLSLSKIAQDAISEIMRG